MELIKENLDGTSIQKIILGNEINQETNTISGSIELDIENQLQFVDHINTLLDDGHTLLLLSMENISYIDSSGLWALFESHKKTEQRNGKIVLLNPRKDVKRVLDITKISSKIKIAETEALAIEYLNNE